MCWSSFHHDNDGDDENDSSLTINWRNSLQPTDVHARCVEVRPRHLWNPRSLPLHPHGNSCSGLNLEFWLWTNSPCFICELYMWTLFLTIIHVHADTDRNSQNEPFCLSFLLNDCRGNCCLSPNYNFMIFVCTTWSSNFSFLQVVLLSMTSVLVKDSLKLMELHHRTGK